VHSEIDLVFWQNTISAHQAPLLRSLSERYGQRVLLVANRGPSDDRRELGWDHLDYGSTELVLGAGEKERSAIMKSTRGAMAHVFSGIGAYPLVDSARREIAGQTRAPHIAVVTESWDPRGLKGIARHARFRARVPSELNTIDSLFTIGQLARSQFIRLGADRNKMLPFAYSVDEHPSVDVPDRSDTALVFVGALTELKNPSLLITALSRLRERNWTLKIVGQGPLRPKLERQIAKSGLGARIVFTGVVTGAQSRAAIASSDLLVLTSRYDGWGAVVSEALMSGTPALVSANAGASEVLVASELGAVFASGDVRALGKALDPRLGAPLEPATRRRVMEWARTTISADAMGQYLLSRFSNPNVLADPPWTLHARK
jgi:glycosyltransferase involved in cell wall biosynthesis